MQDLNDIFYFTEVVTHGGFAPAGRALNQPKSKLSRRIAQLEERLGVRLIERSSRRFKVTEVGQAFHARCQAALLEVRQAEAVIAEARGEPQGLVRISCPLGLIPGPVSEALRSFALRYPKVQLRLLASNQRRDLIGEKIDIAIRARSALDADMALIVRTLRIIRFWLVAAPGLANGLAEARRLSDLAGAPTIGNFEAAGPDVWRMTDRTGAEDSLSHHPRFASGDLETVIRAARDGIGVAWLPDYLCRPHLEEGALVRVLPDWQAGGEIMHMVYTARQGLPPAVRALIEHIVAHVAASDAEVRAAALADPLGAFHPENAKS